MEKQERSIGGGAMVAKPPLDQWNLLISGSFQAPTGAAPPGKKKMWDPPPGQIPEYAPKKQWLPINIYSEMVFKVLLSTVYRKRHPSNMESYLELRLQIFVNDIKIPNLDFLDL